MYIDLKQPLDSEAITFILSNDPYAKRYFIGVYAIDELPSRITKRPAVLIFNFDHSTGKGTHWGAITVLNDSTLSLYYFDSFGVCPLPDELTTFCNNNARRLCVSTRCLQADTSEVCGVYACLFSIIFSMNKNVDSFYDLFPLFLRKSVNDSIACYTLYKYFNVVHKKRMRILPIKFKRKSSKNLSYWQQRQSRHGRGGLMGSIRCMSSPISRDFTSIR